MWRPLLRSDLSLWYFCQVVVSVINLSHVGSTLNLPTTPAVVVHADPHWGNDSNAGTIVAPVKTFCECASRVHTPGSMCLLHAGRYALKANPCILSGLHGSTTSPIVISGAGDGEVILDGTISIVGPWQQQQGPEQRMFYTAQAPQEILQLFVEGDMQPLARYPNAAWDNKSMFLANKNWLKSTQPGVHNTTTGEGVLLDVGPCETQAECCRLCNTHGLAESGINATGNQPVSRPSRHAHRPRSWVG